MTRSGAVARPGLLVRGLLRLYPRSWRARYGAELADLFAPAPLSMSLIVDLIAGAIDARLHPELVARPISLGQEGEAHMLGKLMKLSCAGYGAHITRRDAWLSAAVMLGGTLVFTLVWMRLRVGGQDDPYIDSFALVPLLAAYILSLPFTYLKGRRRSTQVVFVIGSLALVISSALAVGFVTARM